MRNVKLLSITTAIVIFVLITTMISGCSNGSGTAEQPASEQPAGEEQTAEQPAAEQPAEAGDTLKFFVDKSGWQDGFDAFGEAFTKKTGIKVEWTNFKTQEEYLAAVRSGITTDAGPDMFTWWTNTKMDELVQAGLVEDLTPIYGPYAGQFDEGMINTSMTFGDDRIWGVPLNINYWVMFYSKKIFNEYGLQEPQNWDDFVSLCDRLVENDVTPIGLTISGGWTSFFWFQQLLITKYPDLYYETVENRGAWNSEEVKDVVGIWVDLMEKGYFSSPMDMGTEIPPAIAQGEVAMTYCGDWYADFFHAADLVPGEDYDVFFIPELDDSQGNIAAFQFTPVMMSKNAQNPEGARMMADFILSPEGQELWSKAMNFIPVNTTVSTDHLPPTMQKLTQEVAEKEWRFFAELWEATKAETGLIVTEKFDRIILNPGDYSNILDELEAAIREAEGR